MSKKEEYVEDILEQTTDDVDAQDSKHMILDDASSLVEEWEKEDHSLKQDKVSDKMDEEMEEGEASFARQRQEKVSTTEIERKLGYHRNYLRSNIKISNIILLIIAIILGILVLCKYCVPDSVFYQTLEASKETQSFLSGL